jgi:hypothetical protein
MRKKIAKVPVLQKPECDFSIKYISLLHLKNDGLSAMLTRHNKSTVMTINHRT